MADRRMFSKTVISSDLFIDMPVSAQLLYFHLGMCADDDGFVNNPKQIQRGVGCNIDDLKILQAKGFIIPFDSGVIVITHWNVNNQIRKDRYRETSFKNELNLITKDKNGIYITAGNQTVTNRQPTDNHLETQYSIGKVSIVKDSLGEGESEPNGSPPPPSKPKFKIFGEYQHVKLNDEQYSKLISEFGEAVISEYIKRCDEYVQQTGKKYKDYNLTIRNWISKDGGAKAVKAVADKSKYTDPYDVPLFSD
ncbi:MAG TPA: replisome organizer [Ruminococcaceae bacterium]|nr:replisome organizer [Oscillospiraceae bacterium]